MESFGERLQRLRQAKDNMSANEFARRVGKTSAYISLVDRGLRLPDGNLKTHDAQVWADVLGVTVAELVGTNAAAARHQPLSDSQWMIKAGFEIVPDDEADQAIEEFLEEFTASARHGSGNLVPQNYDEMRPKRKPGGKKKPKPEPTTFKLRISGNCLAPRYMGEPHTIGDGEVAMFDITLPREPVCLVFAIKDEHEGHIKRLVAQGEELWLESNDGWSEQLDEHWRLVARAFTAQRRLL